MEEETNEDIKKQVEELKELLQTIKESQDDMVHINKQLNKVLKKFNNK